MADEVKSVDESGVATVETIVQSTKTVEEIDAEIAILKANMQTYQDQIDNLESLKSQIEAKG